MSTPVLENGHLPVGASLDSDGRDVTVLRPIGHYNDQLIGTDLDGMLSPIQRTTFERSCNCITTGVSHMSDDAIGRTGCTPGDMGRARAGIG